MKTYWSSPTTKDTAMVKIPFYAWKSLISYKVPHESRPWQQKATGNRKSDFQPKDQEQAITFWGNTGSKNTCNCHSVTTVTIKNNKIIKPSI